MATYLADKVIVFEGKPSVDAMATKCVCVCARVCVCVRVRVCVRACAPYAIFSGLRCGSVSDML